jgi:hypothetical protein
MPILTLQQRVREIGRIRMGFTKPAKEEGKKGAPAKLSKWRLTSPDKAVIFAAAQVYGGQPQEITEGFLAGEWEVFTQATELDFFISPVPVSQWMEQWTGGGMLRRCDGEHEMVSNRPCICDATGRKECKPHTRLSVILYKLPGMGVWRLETQGWGAATHLAETANMLLDMAVNKLTVPAVLGMVLKRNQRRQKWMEPVINVRCTPAQLVALKAAAGMLPAGTDLIEKLVAEGMNMPQLLQTGAPLLAQSNPQPEQPTGPNWRGRYFKLHGELGWPPHEGGYKAINYLVWSQQLARPVTSGSQLADEDWKKLAATAELVRDGHEPEPSPFDAYKAGRTVTQQDLQLEAPEE